MRPCLWLALLWVSTAAGYNLDTENALHFAGPNGSMFGYTVLLHQNTSTWLVAGAPAATVRPLPHDAPAGGIYKCSVNSAPSPACQLIPTDIQRCGATCQSETDGQWLGVSLSRHPTQGHILACAHRWKNVFHAQKNKHHHKLPNGVCYRYGNNLSRPQALIPCYRDNQTNFGEDYASCQAGMSNFLFEDLIVMGAPGTSYWTGSVLVYNTASKVISAYVDDDSGEVQFGSYLGYAVGAGHFLDPGSTEVVGGAPQYRQIGRVFIFSIDNNMLGIIATVTGDQLGSYFGASVCAVDLNGDGLSDLLVGAPMATSITREEGRVHVYINQGQAALKEAEFCLVGGDSYAARFGESITDLGDLDKDGYHDVVVGAPQEEDLKGAIYIYNGKKDGISSKFSQRISGMVLGRDLRMFGQSLSSGVDIDNNGYQDVAVGAFMSDSAVILRTRPVVALQASLLLPAHLQVRQCEQQPACVSLDLCFSLTAPLKTTDLDILYNLTADLLHKPFFLPRFYFHGNGTSNSLTGQVRARHNQSTCTHHLASLRRDVRDIFTPVQFSLSFSLADTPPQAQGGSPPLRAILQRHNINTVTNQTSFARECTMKNCSPNLQLTAELDLPQSHGNESFVAISNGQSVVLTTTMVNSGDDAFLPQLKLRLPINLHYVKMLGNEDSSVSCDVTDDVIMTTVGVSCSIKSYIMPVNSKLSISFLLDVNQSSSAGDVIILVTCSSENHEDEDYLHDNAVNLTLPLRFGLDISIHGVVTPNSLVFGDEEESPVDCYRETFNYTYQVLNAGPSRSVDTVVEVELPTMVMPYPYILQYTHHWQVSQGECYLRDNSVPLDDCDVPTSPFITQLAFLLSSSSTRRLFCSYNDPLCQGLICRLGNLEPGSGVTITLETKVNPTVLQHSPGRHGYMLLESTAVLLSPRDDDTTILLRPRPLGQAVVEAHFSQRPSAVIKVFIIVFSLVIGLLILAVLVYCLWKAGFFKRQYHKQEQARRESWDYISKLKTRESSI